MKLCPEAMEKVVQIPEVQGSASVWHRHLLALGAGVSVISVVTCMMLAHWAVVMACIHHTLEMLFIDLM